MTIHLIGNAHLDPVWLWRYSEGLAEVRATFRTVLDLMDEFPEFRFTCAGAYAYAWIAQAEPELFERIRRRVAEGRWCVTGGWWIQADCNIPGGEALVRQGFYGQKWFERHLGVRCRCGYCVDSFGHCASLPKILRGCGLDAWVWMRPGEHENPHIPKPYFLWQAGDGAQVMSLRISDQGYACWSAEDLEARIRRLHRLYAGTPFEAAVMCFYGVGDHGGGPTREQLRLIRELADDPSLPELRHSGPEEVLDVLERARIDLPVYRGELQHHASGCYAAVSLIKRLNRSAETELTLAEAWAALARVATGPSAVDASLADAWCDLLFNQFHDILAGTSIPEAYTDAAHQIGGVIHKARWVREVSRQRFAHRMDTRGEGRPLIVFNNTARPYHGLVETEDFAFFRDAPYWRVENAEDGKPVPFQMLRPHSVTRGRRRALLLLDLPPFGCRLLRLRVESEPPAPEKTAAPERGLRVDGRTIENPFLRLSVRPNGGVVLRDKTRDVLVCNAPSGISLVIDDPSDTWSHGVFRFDEAAGQFELRRVRVMERGPLRARIRLDFAWGESTLRLEYSLGCKDRFVRLDGMLDWHERRKLVKLLFHVPRAADRHFAEIPFEVLERPNTGNEEPMQRWVTMPGRDGGLTILNDSIYSYDARRGTVRLTLLRSPLYAHHDPAEAPSDPDVPATDQGERRFALLLAPHADWREAGLPALAEALHAPPETLLEGVHPGDLPPSLSLLEVSDPSVQVAAVKPAENGNGFVVRLVEMTGAERSVNVNLAAGQRTFSVHLRPWQVQTVFIPWDAKAPVRPVNMLEEPVE